MAHVYWEDGWIYQIGVSSGNRYTEKVLQYIKGMSSGRTSRPGNVAVELTNYCRATLHSKIR